MSITGFNRRRRLNAKRKTEQRNTSRPEAKTQQAEQTEQQEEEKQYEEMTYNELRVLAKEKADEKGIELSPTPKKQDCIDILRGE